MITEEEQKAAHEMGSNLGHYTILALIVIKLSKILDFLYLQGLKNEKS